MRWIAPLCLSLLTALAFAAEEPKNIVVNGDFDSTEKPTMGPAAGWKGGEPGLVSVVDEQGNRFLRIELKEKKTAMLEQVFKVPANWAAVKVSVEIRAKNVEVGDQPYKSGMLQYIFYSAENKVIGGWSKRLVKGDHDWTLMQEEVKVPEGAVSFNVQCWGLDCKGTFDFDNVSVVPVLKP